MSSVPKKKVTVKSDIWYIDFNVIKSTGFQESPLFGTESTKFYWRAENIGGSLYSIHLYLAACKEETVHVDVMLTLKWGSESAPNSPIPFKGDVSLDKTRKIGHDSFCNRSHYSSTEVTFEEIDVPTGDVIQQKLYEELSSQLLHLRENINSADMTLVTTVDGREFPVHKSILASRSTVFSAMFEHSEFKENQKNRVEIEDVKGEVMDALLKFIYSADIQGIETIAGELLQAADKYDLRLLVEACVQSLLTHLSVDTAAKCFYLVALYRLEDAKKQVINFIGENRKAVRSSDGWKEFIGPEHVIQLYDSML